jgi:hypothetical protein
MAKKVKRSATAAMDSNAEPGLLPNSVESAPAAVPAPEVEPALAPAPPPPEDASNEALKQELSEVRELARSLFSAVQEVRSQSARNEILRNAIQDVKSDVRAAQQAAVLAPAGSPAAPYADPHGAREGKCGPCECVSDGCCCFDIKISQVRVAKPQMPLEVGDMGDVPFLKNALEIRLYFTIDGTGFLWPGLPTSMEMRADGAPGGPGPWICINRTVKRVCFPRGTNPTFVLEVEGQEVDEGVGEAALGKDEYGEGEGSITLDCCVEKIFPSMPIEVYLQHGGEGRGMVQVAFVAERVCC